MSSKLILSDCRLARVLKNEMIIRFLGFVLFVILLYPFQMFATAISSGSEKISGVDVSGNLIDNDTWARANSPYNIVGDVGVPSGLTLTIEAGVEINYTGDFRILVFGAIQVNGTLSDSVRFNGNSVEGTKYMLEVRKTNLDNSGIDYAVFEGPQGAILQGLVSDATKNTGTLGFKGVQVLNTSIRTNPHDLEWNLNDATSVPSISFNQSSIENTEIYGGIVPVELYTFSFISGCLKNVIFGDVNTKFDSTQITNSRFSKDGWLGHSFIEINNSIVEKSQFSSEPISYNNTPYLKIDKTRIINSPIFANEFDVSKSQIIGNVDDIILLFASRGNGSAINTSFIGNANVIGMKVANPNLFASAVSCTFFGLDVGVTISAGSFTAESSNFLNNVGYHVENLSELNVSSTGNYWDSDSPTIIASKIYDQNDNLELGLVNISGFLTTPNIEAPISPPQNVVKTEDGAVGLDITWVANPESDVAGYKVYWGDFTGYSFENTADAGNVLTYNIPGLSISDSVAITAYDNLVDDTDDQVEGHESWFSFANNVGTDFLSFSFQEQTGSAIIDAANHSIEIEIGYTDNPANLVASFTLSSGSAASINGIEQVSATTSNDFTNQVTYIVTAEDGMTTQDWMVIVTKEIDGLIAYYPFNGNANDESGNGNNGVVEGATLTIDRFGNNNSSYDFDGNDDFIEINTLLQILSPNDNGTINLWVKPDEATPETQQWIFSFGDQDAHTFIAGRLLGDAFSGEVWFMGKKLSVVNFDIETDNVELTDDTWSFLSFVQDGVFPKLYINGILVAQDNITGTDLGFWFSNYPNLDVGRLGCRNDNNFGNSFFYSGAIDDVRIYNRALSAGEILSLYQEGGWPEDATRTDISLFTFPAQTSLATINSSNHTISVEVSNTSDLTDLIATFELSAGATAKVEGEIQESGVTVNDFTNPVTYTITAEDGITTQDWEVTATKEIEGLIAYYPFNGNANDESGNGSDGIVNGASLTSDRFGNTNSAYDFDGVDDYVDLDNVFDFETRTLSMWFNVDDAIKHSILAVMDDDNLSYGLYGASVKDNSLRVSPAGGGTQVFASISPNEWHQLAIVRDFDAGFFYVNGVLVEQTSVSNIHSLTDPHETMLIGSSRGFYSDRFLEGKVDDIRIYNKALSAAEISTLYSEGGWSNLSNTAPTNITLTNNTINENAIAGSTIGTLSTTDNAGDLHTYSLMSGSENFTIVSNELRTSKVFDFETKNNYTINIRSTDSGSLFIDKEFTISVLDVNEEVNQAPQILDATLSVDENSSNGTNVGVVPASDPESDNLIFSVLSRNDQNAFQFNASNKTFTVQDGTKLNFELNQSYVFILQVSDGELTDNGTITININNVAEPTSFSAITAPSNYILSGEGFSVGGSVEDEDGISELWVLFKKASQHQYDSIKLSTDAQNKFSHLFGDENLDNIGVQYKFKSKDILNEVSETQTYITYQQSAEDAIKVEMSGGVGSSVKNYNIISFPFEEPDVSALLTELGPYDSKNWRMYRFNSLSLSYQEYSEFSNVVAGEGYWLIRKNPIEIKFGGRSPELTNGVFKKDLKEGYNMIGNPFIGTLDWATTVQHNVSEGIINLDDIGVENQSNLYTWNTAYLSKSSLNEFEGGIVKVNKDIDGFQFPLTSLSNAGRKSFELPFPEEVLIDGASWELDLFVNTPSYDYYLAGFGMNEEASNASDQYDRSILPHFALYLDVLFDDGFTKSIKKTQGFHSWTFTIPNNLDESHLNVSWDIPISSEKTIILVNGVSKKTHDLQEVGEVNLANNPNTSHYLYFGTKSEIYDNLNLPFDVFFDLYPNPVSDILNIHMYASEEKNATVALIGIDGRNSFEAIIQLNKGTNRKELILDGSFIPQGIYFLKIDNRIITKLVKR